MDNNYTNYNSNETSYEDGSNNRENGATCEDVTGANEKNEDGANYNDNTPVNYEQETMDYNAIDEILGIRDAKETAILDAIENYIATSTTDKKIDTEITGVDVGNTGVHVEIKWVGTDTPGLKDTSHEDKKN